MIISIKFVLFAAVIAVLAVGYKRSKKTQEYDERQELLQNRAYRYAAHDMIFTSAAAVIWSEELMKVLNGELLALLIMLVGIVIYVSYAVLHDAYFPINKTIGMASIGLFGTMSILELIVIIKNLLNHTFSPENGGMSLLLLIAFAIIISVMLYKKHLDKKEADS
ncbi:hypothetical protein ACVR0O_08800 [Streptococcus caviae]|uniref:hypothetical protein n=1 Tax=Streptococcus sp. 'caviae' TaxID=1915004 RepID=UPI00094B9823|nr:hypothetical protein [Streptococcus sp. 'caviae']OLN82533.1 hypothetical protein BMI76_08690 [Streptococcus sp. 'caviae']